MFKLKKTNRQTDKPNRKPVRLCALFDNRSRSEIKTDFTTQVRSQEEQITMLRR